MHHLIGKDILRFHCVYWPAMLLAAGIDPPADIYVHGFLLVGGEKMSKTGLNQIAPGDLVDDFGVDGFRYHFLRDTPSGPTATSATRAWSSGTTADLANNFGNLLSRVATVVGQASATASGPAPGRQPAGTGRGRGLRGRGRGVGRRPAGGRARGHLAADP